MNADKNDKDWTKLAEEDQEHAEKPVSEELNKDPNKDLDEEEEGEEGAEVESAPSASLDHPDYKALQDKLTEAEQAVHVQTDKALRMASELENSRRRYEQELSNAHKFGGQKILEAMLPVIDSLEQAIQMSSQTEGNNTSLIEGVELTMKMFTDVCQKFSLTQIDPIGEAFDPNLHEAVSMQESADVAPGTVLTVFQKGYRLHDRVVRPARVVVSKAPAE